MGTGIDTEIGTIAKILDNEESVQTPLERRLEHLGKVLGQIAIAVCLLIVVIGFFQ